VGHLQQLNEKYYDRGFRIVAISNEATARLESRVVEERGGKYWVASDPGGKTVGGFVTPGSRGIPHGYLVNAFGIVVGEGVPSEGQIEELLADAFDPALGRELDLKLSRAVKAYEGGDFGKAFDQAARYLEDEAIAADAKYLQERVNANAEFRQKLVDLAIESRDYATALADLKKIADQFSGMRVAERAEEREKKLSADPAVKKEIKALNALSTAKEMEARADGNDRKLRSVVAAYRSIMSKYEGTRAAEDAAAAVKRLAD
jgi:hypothetical protein